MDLDLFADRCVGWCIHVWSLEFCAVSRNEGRGRGERERGQAGSVPAPRE